MAKQNLIDVKIDDKEIKRMAKRLGVAKKKLPRVICSALRKTATNVRTIIKQVIRSKAPELPSAQVHKRTSIRPKATYSRLSTRINLSWALIPLKKIKGVRGKGRNPSKSYITFKGRTLMSAFRATMPSGHQGIFMQKIPGSKPILSYTGDLISGGQQGQGLPIQELGVSIKEVFLKASGVKQEIDKKSTEKLRINIVQQFNRLLK